MIETRGLERVEQAKKSEEKVDIFQK